MATCSVSGCGVNHRNNPENFTFHRFPLDPIVREKWLRLIGRVGWSPKKYSTICIKHFPDQYKRKRRINTVLVKGAIPTLFVPDNIRTTTSKIANGPSVPFDDDSDRSGDVHEGFTCNACSGSIVGFRYVCVQCAHYSLCAACEARGEHSLHYVLRIPRLAPHAEVDAVLSKIRTHLVCGLDTEEAEQETDDRVVPALPPEPIKVEIKEEIPDPLEHEDALQPDDSYNEPEYTRESTSKEQRVDTRSIITEMKKNYAILNNPAKVTETEPKTTKHRNIVIEPAHGSRFIIYVEPTQECEAKKRKNTTEPELGSEKHMKMYHEEQSRAIETMMEMSVDTAGQSTEGASELLQEIKTEAKDEGSFEVFSLTSKKILKDAKSGPDTEKNMAASTNRKKVKQNVNI